MTRRGFLVAAATSVWRGRTRRRWALVLRAVLGCAAIAWALATLTCEDAPSEATSDLFLGTQETVEPLPLNTEWLPSVSDVGTERASVVDAHEMEALLFKIDSEWRARNQQRNQQRKTQ